MSSAKDSCFSACPDWVSFARFVGRCGLFPYTTLFRSEKLLVRRPTTAKPGDQQRPNPSGFSCTASTNRRNATTASPRRKTLAFLLVLTGSPLLDLWGG